MAVIHSASISSQIVVKTIDRRVFAVDCGNLTMTVGQIKNSLYQDHGLGSSAGHLRLLQGGKPIEDSTPVIDLEVRLHVAPLYVCK